MNTTMSIVPADENYKIENKSKSKNTH